MRRPLVTTVLGLTLLALPALGHAAPSTEGERLFREGRAAMQEKDYETACARFTESQKKEPAPGTSLNLGECEERRNHLAAAREAFASAAANFTVADKKGYAQTRADALERRVPKVVVRVSGAPKAAVVRAGERVVEIGTELRLDPGDVVFTVEAPASRTKRVPMTLKEGNAVVEVELGPLDSDAPAAVLAKPKSEPSTSKTSTADTANGGGSGLHTAGIALAAVGGASLIVGAVTGILTLGKASTVKDHCDSDLACDPEGSSAASSGKTLSLVSTITVIVGVAGIGAGTVLLLTSPPKKTGMTTFGPGPGDVGLMMKRSF